MRGLLTFVFVWLLAGCVVAPKEVVLYSASDAVEIRHLKRDVSYLNYDRVSVWAVDRRTIGPTYVGGMTKLAPGLRVLLVHFYTKPGFGPEFESYVQLTVDLPAASRLMLNGKAEGGEAVVWLEDAASGTLVGQPTRGPLSIAPRY
jgi:hypothetical protein